MHASKMVASVLVDVLGMIGIVMVSGTLAYQTLLLVSFVDVEAVLAAVDAESAGIDLVVAV